MMCGLLLQLWRSDALFGGQAAHEVAFKDEKAS